MSAVTLPLYDVLQLWSLLADVLAESHEERVQGTHVLEVVPVVDHEVRGDLVAARPKNVRGCLGQARHSLNG